MKNSEIQGVPKGFLNASITEWTNPAQLVKKITQDKMERNTAEEALSLVQGGFEAVENSKNQQLALVSTVSIIQVTVILRSYSKISIMQGLQG